MFTGEWVGYNSTQLNLINIAAKRLDYTYKSTNTNAKNTKYKPVGKLARVLLRFKRPTCRRRSATLQCRLFAIFTWR